MQPGVWCVCPGDDKSGGHTCLPCLYKGVFIVNVRCCCCWCEVWSRFAELCEESIKQNKATGCVTLKNK